jgi:plasmid maintenance system antidote protein VapI
MDYKTACDLLALEASSKVLIRAEGIEAEQAEDQSFGGWYLSDVINASSKNKQELADTLGVSRTFLYGLMSGKKKMSDNMVETLADVLPFTVAELLVVRAMDYMIEVGED